jgi:hypothetical protein
MTLKIRLFGPPLLRRSAVAIAMAAVCAGAWADSPPFTLDPSAAATALNGTAFTADNILVSDYSKVTLDSGAGTFTDTGLLSVIGFQLGDTLVLPTGLNTDYGLYISFTGHGTTAGNPTTQNTTATFTDLTYTLYGYNGSATFGLDASNNPTETANEADVLATGSLINGTASTTLSGLGPLFTPSASASLTFVAGADAGSFFKDPNPFYDLAFAAFTNTTTQVVAFNGGFAIKKGGGAFNFAATPPVPEPGTYALLLGGLGAIGFVTRRRRNT